MPAYIVGIMQDNELRSVPDDELLRRLAEILRQSRRVEADLVAHIAEVDARRLYARSASPSMFAYATEVLHLSEAEAYLRIAAARASREHPILLAMLADGRLHLTAIAKIAPHLTAENREGLLARAVHKSKREIEELVAEVSPRPDVPAVMRRLPDRPGQDAVAQRPGAERGHSLRELRLDVATAGDVRLESGVTAGAELRLDGVAPQAERPVGPCARPSLGQAPTPAVSPLAPGRYKVQFTASAALRDKLERLRGLMRSSVPDGDLAAIIEQAVSEKLERLEALRFARTSKPRKTVAASDTSPRTRQIPAAIKRAVHERDGGRCRYVDEQGRRCGARDRLEFHHRHPFGFGGDHSEANVALVCHEHNHRLAEIDYGQRAMEAHRASRRTDRRAGSFAIAVEGRAVVRAGEPLPVTPSRSARVAPVAEGTHTHDRVPADRPATTDRPRPRATTTGHDHAATTTGHDHRPRPPATTDRVHRPVDSPSPTPAHRPRRMTTPGSTRRIDTLTAQTNWLRIAGAGGPVVAKAPAKALPPLRKPLPGEAGAHSAPLTTATSTMCTICTIDPKGGFRVSCVRRFGTLLEFPAGAVQMLGCMRASEFRRIPA